MDEEPVQRIRPIWVIGGGALVVVVGVCALISIATAALLIWFSNGISSHDATPTLAVVQNATRAAATFPPPTSLPAFNTAMPPISTPVTALRPAPDQAVKSYYELVSQKRFDLTWSMLTDAFKQKFNCCAPAYDYAGYLNWWNSVNHVEFGSVSTVSQNGDQAVVYAQLYYVMNTGARSTMDSSPYFELIYDPASGSWRFNDKRGAP